MELQRLLVRLFGLAVIFADIFFITSAEEAMLTYNHTAVIAVFSIFVFGLSLLLCPRWLLKVFNYLDNVGKD